MTLFTHVVVLAGATAVGVALVDWYRDRRERVLVFRIIQEMAKEAGRAPVPKDIFLELCNGKSLSRKLPGDFLFEGPRYTLGVITGMLSIKEGKDYIDTTPPV